jgi:FeS assembly SUF system protein
MEPGKPQRIPLETADTHPPPAAAEPSGPEAPPAPAQLLDADAIEAIREKVIDALRTCFDPEIPVNIYELGLVYNVEVSPTGLVHIQMTLTSPACPAAGSLPPEVRGKVKAVPGVTEAKVDVVWEPPWHMGLMSEAARVQLGLDY